MENKTHSVTILWDDEKYTADPATIENVTRGDKVVFFSPNSNAKISFPDSGVINITGWETIKKGSSIEGIVETSVEGTYYYAVMCEHDRKYLYAEGNSCPAMKVGG